MPLYTIARADTPDDTTRPGNDQIYAVLAGAGFVVSSVYQDWANIYVDATTDPTATVNAITPAKTTPWLFEDDLFNRRNWGDTGTGILRQLPDADHPGMIEIETGAANGNAKAMFLGSLQDSDVLHADVGFDITWIAAPFSANNFIARLGLANNWGAAPSGSGIWFQAAPGTDANWQYVCRSATVQTKTDSGVVVTSLWKRLRVRKFPDTATVLFSINGGTETAITTNIPTVGLNPGAQMETTQNALKVLQLDYFSLGVPGLVR